MPRAAPKHGSKVTKSDGGAPPGAYSHVEKAMGYAWDITTGKRPACKWVKLACQRHLNDLKRAEGDWVYAFETTRAERVCRFIEKLPHVKAKWARVDPANLTAHLVRLEPWQCFILCVLFGWVRRDDGKRRFRLAYLCVPRKNGKSLICGGIGLYMLCADNEMGAEIYAGATNEKQAWEVFGPARLMALRTPALLQHFGVEVNAQNLHILAKSSKFEPLIGKPGDGASPSCAIHDEYHEHQTSDQFDTMLTGMGAREQALQLIATTAGDNTAGPCYDLQLTIQQILEGVIEDEEKFGIIYTIDAEDSWVDPASLIKANPNVDISVSQAFLESRQKEAVRNAREQQRFKVKHLNMWVGSRSAYFDMQRWAECADPTLRIEDFRGRPCRIGLDLASKVDIAALEILFPPMSPGEKWATFGKHYLPEETVELGPNEHYRAWRDTEDGTLVVTDGNITDYERIEADILDFCSWLQVEEVGYDPHQATFLVTRLTAQGVPCVEYRPVVLNFSEPMKQIDALIRARKLRHAGDPCMTWMMGNVVAHTDAKDNVFPRKEREEKKIDGPVALITAMGRAMVEIDGGETVYDAIARNEKAQALAMQRQSDASDQLLGAAEAPGDAAPAPPPADAIDYDILNDIRNPLFGEMKRRFEERQARTPDIDEW